MRSQSGSFSLRAKLVALVTALLAVVVGVLLAFLLRKLDTQAAVWMERRATGVAAMLASAVAPGVEFNDPDAPGETLESLASAPGALYAEVRRPDGTRLAGWRAELAKGGGLPQELPPAAREPQVLVREGALHVGVQVPLKNGGFGTLYLGFSLEELERARASNLTFALLLALGVFVLGTGAAFLLGTVLVRPIRQISQVARQIAQGSLGDAERGLGGAAVIAEMAASDEVEADEVRQLAGAFARMLVALRDTNSALRDSSVRLSASVSELVTSTSEQQQSVGQQAQAIQRTVSMAEECRRASLQAAGEAASVLAVASRASTLGQTGEASLALTVEGLGQIRRQVEEIAGKIGELGQGTQRIAKIAETVKDLADQSAIVALNAAIEAARAGEQGRSFAVVARELRKLANQSGTGAKSVQSVLLEFTRSMVQAVSITEDGSHRIQEGLGQVSASGQHLRDLSTMVGDSARAVQQIASTVDTQNAAIEHLFDSTSALSRMMQDTVHRIELTNRTAAVVQEVSRVVSEVAQRYRD